MIMQLQKGDLLNKMIKEIKKVYKIVNDIELILKVYVPKDWRWEDRRPAIVFFFGGGWENGTIDHFKTQSQYLAARGMVGITPDYRVGSRHGVTPFECVKDGKAALEWVKENAGELGIDAGKIVVGGGSAGGHIAACMAVLKNSEFDDRQIYKIPKAMILFNPVVDTSEKGYGYKKIGACYREISPLYNVSEGLPPTIIFHGTHDKVVLFDNARAFQEAMQNAGNSCTLIPYEGKGHGFFNEHNDQWSYIDTLRRTDMFLRQLGYISGEPQLV